MTRKKTRKKTSQLPRKRISPEQLTELSELYDSMHLLQVELKEKGARLDSLIAKRLVELGQPVRTTSICLDCGASAPKGQPCGCGEVS